MAIKIKKDGKVSNFIINSTDIKVLDVANKFKNKNLESVITDISDTEKVHFGDVDINKTGLWIDNATNLDSSENNNVVDRIKNYFNGIIGDLKSLATNSKDTIVNAINELNKELNDCVTREQMLTSPLEIGEWIDFHLKGNESIDFDARLYLNGTSKEIRLICNSEEHAIMTTKCLYDGLDSTKDGFALDSKQGKALYDLISDLKQKYDNQEYSIHDTDLNEIKDINRECYTFNCTNAPKGLSNSYGFLKVRYFDGSGFVPGKQTLQEFISYDNSKVYRRTFNGEKNTWSAWVSS